ncbi:hypothetical protein Clacol_002125 [Clathrus columnatus]|uniref:Uncharacterized protein n=1 Tax=Clathrus columnatus TaxID=1419009 RepID=A0AAV4ZZX4_9AGAM|nr:hypothetical protein Clacol_002125 [Clathrus columnatus]
MYQTLKQRTWVLLNLTIGIQPAIIQNCSSRDDLAVLNYLVEYHRHKLTNRKTLCPNQLLKVDYGIPMRDSITEETDKPGHLASTPYVAALASISDTPSLCHGLDRAISHLQNSPKRLSVSKDQAKNSIDIPNQVSNTF